MFLTAKYLLRYTVYNIEHTQFKILCVAGRHNNELMFLNIEFSDIGILASGLYSSVTEKYFHKGIKYCSHSIYFQ